MKEIEVHAWCDGSHDSREGRVPAVIEVRLSVNGSRPRLLDLCATHDSELAALVAAGASVTDTTVPPKGAGGRKVIEGPHNCPICDSEHASRNAMTKHLRAAHQTSIKELAERSQT